MNQKWIAYDQTGAMNVMAKISPKIQVVRRRKIQSNWEHSVPLTFSCQCYKKCLYIYYIYYLLYCSKWKAKESPFNITDIFLYFRIRWLCIRIENLWLLQVWNRNNISGWSSLPFEWCIHILSCVCAAYLFFLSDISSHPNLAWKIMY